MGKGYTLLQIDTMIIRTSVRDFTEHLLNQLSILDTHDPDDSAQSSQSLIHSERGNLIYSMGIGHVILFRVGPSSRGVDFSESGQRKG